jgi:glycosyltransferase involved in cell wall biosynthesis
METTFSPLTKISIHDLPPPPDGKHGWPWILEQETTSSTSPDLSSIDDLPLISVVTPSYGYGDFIEETIRSVLLQNYPRIEYIVIDGASKDATVDVMNKYQKFFKYSVSEPDRGQTDAINKGFTHCSGDIFVWLNADDAFAHPDCFYQVAQQFQAGNKLIVGACQHVDAQNLPIILPHDEGYSIPQSFIEYCRFWSYSPLPQPATFVDRRLAEQAFPLDADKFWAMDFQFFARVLKQQPQAIWLKHRWVNFKVHGANKTANTDVRALNELLQISTQEIQTSEFNPLTKWLFMRVAHDYHAILILMGDVPNLNSIALSKRLLATPSFMFNSLFLKIFLRALLGDRFYEILKQRQRLISAD